MRSSAQLAGIMVAAGILLAQTSGDTPVISNQKDLQWSPETGTPGADGALLHEEAATGAMELLVHYPAGHVFTPHWHSANERIFLLEGTMSIQVGSVHKELQPGGYAFLPAKQVQTMSCGAASRCG